MSISPERRIQIGLAATGVLILAGTYATQHPGFAPERPTTPLGLPTGTPEPSPTSTLTPSPTPEPSPTPQPTETIKPTGIEFKPFNNAQEVANVRGGNPDLWVPKAEIYDGVDSNGNPDPSEYREIHTIDGETLQTSLSKLEWVYRGPMTDLKPEYQIPQTAEEVATKLGGNVHPENVRLIKITHDTKNAGYAPWMDLWTVPEGTVVGYELMQNHQGEAKIYPYEFELSAGSTIEMYDDQQTENGEDDIAAVIYNPSDKPMKMIASGGTIWPWGDPWALTVEQSNYENGASSFAVDKEGKLIGLSVASNVRNPYTTHYMAEVDPKTGKVSLDGFNLVAKNSAFLPIIEK